jgi:hypothetical protein
MQRRLVASVTLRPQQQRCSASRRAAADTHLQPAHDAPLRACSCRLLPVAWWLVSVEDRAASMCKPTVKQHVPACVRAVTSGRDECAVRASSVSQMPESIVVQLGGGTTAAVGPVRRPNQRKLGEVPDRPEVLDLRRHPA